MTKVRILGPRGDVERVVGELHRLGLVEIADARESEALDAIGDENVHAEAGELRLLATGVDALLEQITPGRQASAPASPDVAPTPLDAPALTAELSDLAGQIDGVRRRLDALSDERLTLPGYLEPLRRLLPLVPELADLDDERLSRLRLGTVALVLNTVDEGLVELLRDELTEHLDGRFDLAWTRVEDGAIGCLIVFPQEQQPTVRALLGRAQVREAGLPEAFARLSLRSAVDAMGRRLRQLPDLETAAEAERDALLLPRAPRLEMLRTALGDEIERLEATERIGATRRAFVAVCWVPRRELSRLRTEIDARLGATVVVEDLATSPRDAQAPLLMRNSHVVRPFEPLVRFLELPRAGSLDPTLLMALVLPLMLGAMVGDVGYGAVLFAVGLLTRRWLRARTSALASVTWIVLAGAAWSIVFGVLFGEFFGDLGMRIVGDWAVWRYRPAAETLEPLLLLAVALGAAHIGLGLVLGAWQSVRFGERRDLFDKLGALLVLAGLFGLAGWAADHLPPGALTASVAATIVGLVLVMTLHGALGLITGPLALLGFVGNILSYLRIAAVGLASAHLAGVANALATVGPIWMGVLVAAFFHALNLALAVFSPTIQALRLHYVEFFGTFFVGGGRAFRPFGRAPAHEIPAHYAKE